MMVVQSHGQLTVSEESLCAMNTVCIARVNVVLFNVKPVAPNDSPKEHRKDTNKDLQEADCVMSMIHVDLVSAMLNQ